MSKAVHVADYSPYNGDLNEPANKVWSVESRLDTGNSGTLGDITVPLIPPVEAPVAVELLHASIASAWWNLADGQKLHIVQANAEVMDFFLYSGNDASLHNSGGNWSLPDLADFIQENINAAQSLLASPQGFVVYFRPERNVITITSGIQFDVHVTNLSEAIGWTTGSNVTNVLTLESATALDLNENKHSVYIRFPDYGWSARVGGGTTAVRGFAKVSVLTNDPFSVQTWSHLGRYTMSANSDHVTLQQIRVQILDEDGEVIDMLMNWNLTLRFWFYRKH